MDTKREGPADETDLFIAQCETLRLEMQDRSLRRRGEKANFGKLSAAELLWAIGRYAVENDLEIKTS